MYKNSDPIRVNKSDKNEFPAINELCLSKDKSARSKSHLFALGKAIYTYKNAVTPQLEQPTHLRVICS